MKTLNFLLISAMAVIISYSTQGQTSSVKDEIAKAQNLAQQGNTAEASKIYTGIMEKFPDNRDAVQGWLMINMERSPNGEEGAIKQLEELEKSYPENKGILFFKTFLQTEYKHFDEALTGSEKLTRLQPDSAINWLMKGQILESMDRNEEALNSYEKATSLDSHNSDAWQNKAGLLAKTNKLDEAIDSYTRAIQLTPGQPVFIYNRGCVYCRKGDFKNALTDLAKAVSIEPRLKSYASKDEDFKDLWENEDFKKIVSQ
jgi:tetratricopeptide (TPR) repeat protein